MRYAEAMKLKEGDLVIVDSRNKNYGGFDYGSRKYRTRIQLLLSSDFEATGF